MPAPISGIFPKIDDPANSFYSSLRSLFASTIPITPIVSSVDLTHFLVTLNLSTFGQFNLTIDLTAIEDNSRVFAKIPISIIRENNEEPTAGGGAVPVTNTRITNILQPTVYTERTSIRNLSHILYSDLGQYHLTLYVLIGNKYSNGFFSPAGKKYRVNAQKESFESLYKPEIGMEWVWSNEDNSWQLYSIDSRQNRILVDSSDSSYDFFLTYGARRDSSAKNLVTYTYKEYFNIGQDDEYFHSHIIIMERPYLPKDTHLWGYSNGYTLTIDSTNYIRVKNIGEQLQEGEQILDLRFKDTSDPSEANTMYIQNNTNRFLFPSFVRVHPKKKPVPYTQASYADRVSPLYREEVMLALAYLDRINLRLFIDPAHTMSIDLNNPLPKTSHEVIPEELKSTFEAILARTYPGLSIQLPSIQITDDGGVQHTFYKIPRVHNSAIVGHLNYCQDIAVHLDSATIKHFPPQQFYYSYSQDIDYINMYLWFFQTASAFMGYSKNNTDYNLFSLWGRINDLQSYTYIGSTLYPNSDLGIIRNIYSSL